MLETLDDSAGVYVSTTAGEMEVEKVPTFLALIERSKLRPEEFVELISPYRGGAFEPSRVDTEFALLDAELREVLAGIDLNLEPHLD